MQRTDSGWFCTASVMAPARFLASARAALRPLAFFGHWRQVAVRWIHDQRRPQVQRQRRLGSCRGRTA
jgi:hypothetical protein